MKKALSFLLFWTLFFSPAHAQFKNTNKNYSNPIEYVPNVQQYSVNINELESKGTGRKFAFLEHEIKIVETTYNPETKYWKYKIKNIAHLEGAPDYLRFAITDMQGKHLRHDYIQFPDHAYAHMFLELMMGNTEYHVVYDLMFKSVYDQSNGLRFINHPAVMIYNTAAKTQTELYELVKNLGIEQRRSTGEYGLHLMEMYHDWFHSLGKFKK